MKLFQITPFCLSLLGVLEVASADATSPYSKLGQETGECHLAHLGDCVVPLSSEQEQIWLHAILVPGLPLYNETVAIRFRGELSLDALESSLYELRRRHDILRTTIEEHNGTPFQHICDATRFKVEATDLSSLPQGEKEQQAAALVSEFVTRVFDLAQGPLLRALVVKFGIRESYIYLTFHHLIFDGVSIHRVVIPELVEFYKAFIAGQKLMLPKVKMSYADYASSQKTKVDSSRTESLNFLKAKLANLSSLSLPTDRPKTPQTSLRGATHTFTMDQSTSDSIRAMARRQKSTVFNVVFASFVVLLARYSDTADVTIGTTYDGRVGTELEDILGCFLNMLLLRTNLSGDPNLSDVIARVRETTLEAMEHANVPFQDVVHECLKRASIGDAPVQVVFSFQPPSFELPEGWELDSFAISNGTAKFDLHVEFEEQDGIFRGRLLYNTDLFDFVTIEALQRHWMNLLRAALAEPETVIWELPLLTASEQEWHCNTLNQTQRDFAQLCVQELFVQKAVSIPHQTAVSCGSRSLTYGQLDRCSANIAQHLLNIGFGPGTVIGLMVDRSPEMLAALLGIMRAGATYVPMDPNYPAARLEHMLKASGASLLLTQASLKSCLPNVQILSLNVADCLIPPTDEKIHSSLPKVSLSASAYIIFTSGSTGVPKGVEIPHVAVTNLLCSMLETPGIRADDVLLSVTSVCFDIAALELFLPLIAGARVEIASAEEAANPELLAERIRDSAATILQATPVSWRMLIENGWTGSPDIKILCGGEALTENLAQQLQQCSSSVWNMYGPTETTIWSSCARIERDFSQITLGEPVANTKLYVLDTHRNLVPAGVGGELYIGGTGLAVGYHGQPDVTRDRFPFVSLKNDETSRLYRTGDRVKRLRDGSLVFLGRTDRQVKLNGFRIELGEIEQVLNSLPGVQESVVIKSPHPSAGDILVGFIIPKVEYTLDLEGVRSGLKEFLPHYMQPAKLHILTDVPLTPNGKLDRNRLPELILDEDITVKEPPLPGTEQVLSNIWCELLQVPAVGRRDNFFDMGGHSLLAARFIARASRAFGHTFTLASLVQAPTIAQFASIVHGHSAPDARMAKRGSTGKQLLWIGAETWLMQLARYLHSDLTLYTLTLDTTSFSDGNTVRTIEAMAAQVVQHIREVQPQGPYLLGGYCLHSLLALEVAQQLQASGEEIALLVMADIYAPGLVSAGPLVDRVVKRVRSESFRFSRLIRWPVREWGPYVSHRWERLFNQIKGVESLPAYPRDLQEALEGAEPRYRSTPYHGKVLFLESDEGRLFEPTTSESWNQLFTDVEVYSYPGEHESVLKEPQLGLAAEAIQKSIDRVLHPVLLR